MPSQVSFLGLIYPIAGVVLAGLAFGQNMLPLLYPLAFGFALVGPFVAIGLYELSRRREQGLPTDWTYAVEVVQSPAIGSIAALGVVLLVIFMAWLFSAQALYEWLYGYRPVESLPLNADGIRVIMLTGDNRITAQAVGAKLGIMDIEAEVLPEEKSAVVNRHKEAGRVVAMAGDGVNDAPALAAADVGIAMGSGTDVAIESAGVTLLKGDLTGIVQARRLSQATMGNIRQNLFLAFVYNAAGIPLAAGVLYPVFGLLLSPALAAGAMALSSVSVIANASRLRLIRL